MELPIFNTYMNFSRHHHFSCFTIVPLSVSDKSIAQEQVPTTLLLQKFVF
jgi:hypothetical protein